MKDDKDMAEILASGPGILDARTRSVINDILHGFGTHYHVGIPLPQIVDILESKGVTAVQEDGTPWSGFLTGADGRASIELMFDGVLATNAQLNISWHKMDFSGKYEVTAYVS